ncbi:UNVERIFIED_CONTAM: hypothetical protein Slati_4097500 [Sesamum latifolium]|uniref:Uncharacterized protein n=1 Tax=Sesamum latifolium TaxID=2727402 RepID=A0AAW2TAH9_9LAMI
MGTTGGGAEPRISRRVRNALRLELSVGSGVRRRADGGVAPVRGAEDEQGGDGGGYEGGVEDGGGGGRFRSGGGGGAAGERADGIGEREGNTEGG